MSREDKIQHDLVMWFSQEYPNIQDCLLMLQNTTYSVAHGNRMKAMGLRKGAPDLILICNSFILGIELKAPNSRHKKGHVLRQLNFGISNLENRGHYYIMSSDLEFVKNIIVEVLFGSMFLAKKMIKENQDMIFDKIHMSSYEVVF